MIQLLNTEKGCPRSQIYLECGLYPLRFEIMKMKILLFQYILKEDPSSLIHQFYTAQQQNTRKGDWISQLRQNLEYLNMECSNEQIRIMSRNNLKSLLKEKIQYKALRCLLTLRKSKGNEIDYEGLQMADYLSPNDLKLAVIDKLLLFAIRNKMINIQQTSEEKELGMECA